MGWSLSVACVGGRPYVAPYLHPDHEPEPSPTSLDLIFPIVSVTVTLVLVIAHHLSVLVILAHTCPSLEPVWASLDAE